MPIRGRKQVIAILLKLKAQGRLREFLRSGAARSGSYQIPASRSLESLRRAVLSFAPIEKSWRMKALPRHIGGGSSRPYVLHLKGGQKALFKPLSTGGNAEIVAYQVSRVLGFPAVPPTVLRRTRYGVGSAQQWVSGRERKAVSRALLEAGRFARESKGKITPPILKQWHEMKVYDFLIDNYDRAPGNFKWDPRASRLIAIDQAESFLGRPDPAVSWRALGMDKTFHEMGEAERLVIGGQVKGFLRKRDHLEKLVSRLPKSATKGIELEPVFKRAQYYLDQLAKPVPR